MTDESNEGGSVWAAEKTNVMWSNLGAWIAKEIPNIVEADDPVKAILWATCAEACFWQATGECDSFNVKDALARLPAIKHTDND